MPDPERIYTIDEARALMPQVRAILLQVAVERRRADGAHSGLHAHLAAGRERSTETDEAEARTARLRAGVAALLDHLGSLGIVVRDLDDGLVDFPTLRDGRRAWLCWRLADADVAYWHTTREGFSSRRPL